MINEASSTKKLEFIFNDKKEVIIGSNREILRKLVDFCYTNGYKFNELSIEDVLDKISKTTLTMSSFHKLPSGGYIGGFDNANAAYLSGTAKKYLSQIGEVSDIKFSDSDSTKITPFIDFVNDSTPVEEPVSKIKVYQKNPFRQSICVLGESGAGKSVTIETILENEGHNFEFIIPTAATTGLLAQFSPSKSGYVPSRLGKMLIEASKNPQKLYTAVFDEMHKSNVIEMINDELLQAISTKRNRGRRFISLDDDTAEIYQSSELDTERGNLLIPDNFGFIFISSKPRVIANNADFFNRVDIVILKSYEEETIDTTDELLSNTLDDFSKKNL